METLPRSLWIRISKQLDCKTLIHLGSTCRYLYEIMHSDPVWRACLRRECAHWSYLDSTWQHLPSRYGWCGHTTAAAGGRSDPIVKHLTECQYFWTMKPTNLSNYLLPSCTPAMNFLYIQLTGSDQEEQLPLDLLCIEGDIDTAVIPLLDFMEVFFGSLTPFDFPPPEVAAFPEIYTETPRLLVNHCGCIFLLNEAHYHSWREQVLDKLAKLKKYYFRNQSILEKYVLILFIVRPLSEDKLQMHSVLQIAEELDLFSQPLKWNVFRVRSNVSSDLAEWIAIKKCILRLLA